MPLEKREKQGIIKTEQIIIIDYIQEGIYMIKF